MGGSKREEEGKEAEEERRELGLKRREKEEYKKIK